MSRNLDLYCIGSTSDRLCGNRRQKSGPNHLGKISCRTAGIFSLSSSSPPSLCFSSPPLPSSVNPPEWRDRRSSRSEMPKMKNEGKWGRKLLKQLLVWVDFHSKACSRDVGCARSECWRWESCCSSYTWHRTGGTESCRRPWRTRPGRRGPGRRDTRGTCPSLPGFTTDWLMVNSWLRTLLDNAYHQHLCPAFSN